MSKSDENEKNKKDFFISYNKADRNWAEWIAWELEEAQYTTILQAWDFLPGSNFILEMNRAACQADRTIAVLSPDYLNSQFTQPEWAAAFAQDPTGQNSVLVPVRVREFNVKGLLPQIVYIDLVEAEEASAKDALLKGVQRGRAKPKVKPKFPGQDTRSVKAPPPFPGSDNDSTKESSGSASCILVSIGVLLAIGLLTYFIIGSFYKRELPTILESDFAEEVLASKERTLVFFCVNYNSACKVMTPILTELAEEYRGKVKIVMMDVVVNENLPEKYKAGYFNIPMVILFKDGSEVARLSGASSKAAIIRMINNN